MTVLTARAAVRTGTPGANVMEAGVILPKAADDPGGVA
jgi:hypothetical protein